LNLERSVLRFNALAYNVGEYMRYLNLVLFCVVACSSSVAQDSKILPQPAPVIHEQEVIKIVEPEPELRKSVRKSKLECEWLTKICVSEGGFNYDECEKLLQTLENMKGKRSLLFAMYAQSSRITRRKPFTSTRQIWVSHLPMQGKKPPEKGWVQCVKKGVPKGCTGSWFTTLKRWLPFRDKVRDLYYSGIVPEPVPGRPIQWGGNMDYWIGAGRNFCPLNKGGLWKNTYWGNPDDPANEGHCLPIDQKKLKSSKVLSASIASGRAMQKPRIQQMLSGDPFIQNHSKGETDERTRTD